MDVGAALHNDGGSRGTILTDDDNENAITASAMFVLTRIDCMTHTQCERFRFSTSDSNQRMKSSVCLTEPEPNRISKILGREKKILIFANNIGSKSEWFVRQLFSNFQCFQKDAWGRGLCNESTRQLCHYGSIHEMREHRKFIDGRGIALYVRWRIPIMRATWSVPRRWRWMRICKIWFAPAAFSFIARN